MALSAVDLPLPDGPTKARISPGATVSSTSRGMGLAWWSLAVRPACAAGTSRMAPANALSECVAESDGHQRNQQQQRRHPPRRGVIEGLHAIIDRNGDSFGLAGNAAAHHQHHPELP